MPESGPTVRGSYDLAQHWRNALQVQVKRDYETDECTLVFIDYRTRSLDYGSYWHHFRPVPGWAPFELPSPDFHGALRESLEYLHQHWKAIEAACRQTKDVKVP